MDTKKIEDKLDRLIELLELFVHVRQETEKQRVQEDNSYLQFASCCELLGVTDEEVYQDYLDFKIQNNDGLPPVPILELRKAIRKLQPDFTLKNTKWGGENVRVWRRK